MSFHVNPATGQPGPCHATVSCPFGGEDQHKESPEAAREAYEATMGGAFAEHFDSLKFGEALKSFPNYMVSKADVKVLDDISAGKRPSDEKLDAFLDNHRELATVTPYNSVESARSASNLFKQVRMLRSESSRPSTLATATSFDPATQTLFSNAAARKDSNTMGKAIRKEAAHGDWMRERAAEERASSALFADEPELSASYLQSAANLDDSARRSDARLAAQLKELQYCYDNDEDFRKNTKSEVQVLLNQGYFRPERLQVDPNVPIGTVKKVR